MGTSIHGSEPEWARQGQTGLVQLQAFNPQLQERLREPGPLVMNVTVDLLWLLSEPLAVQRRAVKAIGELAGLPLEFRHVEEILRFAAEEGDCGKGLSLPLGWTVLREPAALTMVHIGALPWAVSFVAAFAAGIWSIRWLVALLQRGHFYAFAPYCWAVGLFTLAYALWHG